METKNTERRKEPRYQTSAKVVIQKERAEPIAAVAADISSSGMLLHMSRPGLLCLGEVVTIDVELPDHSEQPFSSWGIGTVVRVDTEHSAIQICAGIFDPVSPDDSQDESRPAPSKPYQDLPADYSGDKAKKNADKRW
ncbi:MAG: PilZ domain-containing protein [Bryobacteraceae bacterium]|jgi:hypothetical protein